MEATVEEPCPTTLIETPIPTPEPTVEHDESIKVHEPMEGVLQVEQTLDSLPELPITVPIVESEYDSYDRSEYLVEQFNSLSEHLPTHKAYFRKLGKLLSRNDPTDVDFDAEFFSDSFDSIHNRHFTLAPTIATPTPAPIVKKSDTERTVPAPQPVQSHNHLSFLGV